MKLSTLLSVTAVALLLGAAAPARAEGAGADKAPAAKADKAAEKAADKADKPADKAEAAAPRSFPKKPAVGTKATCAVSGETFTVKKSTQTATHKGRTYAFCCPDCKGDFEKDPEKFADKPDAKK